MSKKIVTLEHDKLLQFIRECKCHIMNIDKIMLMKESVERGKLFAREMNKFNFSYDTFLHFGLNIPFSKFKSIEKKSFDIRKYKKEGAN
jgi:hypothetical protein